MALKGRLKTTKKKVFIMLRILLRVLSCPLWRATTVLYFWYKRSPKQRLKEHLLKRMRETICSLRFLSNVWDETNRERQSKKAREKQKNCNNRTSHCRLLLLWTRDHNRSWGVKKIKPGNNVQVKTKMTYLPIPSKIKRSASLHFSASSVFTLLKRR